MQDIDRKLIKQHIDETKKELQKIQDEMEKSRNNYPDFRNEDFIIIEKKSKISLTQIHLKRVTLFNFFKNNTGKTEIIIKRRCVDRSRNYGDVYFLEIAEICKQLLSNKFIQTQLTTSQLATLIISHYYGKKDVEMALELGDIHLEKVVENNRFQLGLPSRERESELSTIYSKNDLFNNFIQQIISMLDGSAIVKDLMKKRFLDSFLSLKDIYNYDTDDDSDDVSRENSFFTSKTIDEDTNYLEENIE